MPPLELDTSVRFVRGVGPGRSEELGSIGIETVSDLIHICPLRYEQQPACKPIGSWSEGQLACVAGQLVDVRWRGGQRSRLSARIADGHGHLRAVWFNAHYLRSKLSTGRYICATSKLTVYDRGLQMVNPSFSISDDFDTLQVPTEQRWRPIYSAVGGIGSKLLEKMISTCLESVDDPHDYLPRSIRSNRKLVPLADALRQLHAPHSADAASRARRRLAYDELLIHQLEFMRARRQRSSAATAPPLAASPAVDVRIRRRMPFEFTADQNQAVQEICADMASAHAMHRLLHGEVGSGKTAVAVYAALLTIARGHQAVLLAPTEILAHQHFEKLRGTLEGSTVSLACLTGGLSPALRTKLLERLHDGEVNLVVGTHALLEPDVRFQRLGLVIIDEQHRFGVNQRAMLKFKGSSPHYLILSATPIPRTQALAIYGDVETSVLAARPAGRGRTTTHLVKPSALSEAWSLIRKELQRGKQAYIVYPLVEESDKLPLKAVTAEFDRLQARELRQHTCRLLHGRMRSREKEQTITAFRNGHVQVLVCTTVVEVGVDVPNATVMAVFHGERYGLAQLHQLRGRVGRGNDDAHFFMFTDTTDDTVLRRLHALVQTSDGFEIAKMDLQLRGPGELLGTAQHGAVRYRFADLAADDGLLLDAHQDALAIARGRIALSKNEKTRFTQLQSMYKESRASLVHVA